MGLARCKTQVRNISGHEKPQPQQRASCIQALTEIIDDQRARGVLATVLVAALGGVALKAATACRRSGGF